MLDIIRKKASAWGIKVIFGIIILVFVFFFGYNRMSQRMRGARGGSVVARVNGATIGRPEFQLAYENTYKMYQQIFKGSEGEGLPEGIEKGVRTSTLEQLIRQTIIEKVGRDMGVGPTASEIADSIRNSEVAKGEDGKFDPYMYKQRFLPYFSQKFNLDYEALVLGDILSQKTIGVFASSGKIPDPKSLFDAEKTKWTFETTEKGGKSKKAESITILDRKQLFGAEADVEVWEKIFSLSKEKPSLSEPVKVGEKWYMVKFLKAERPTEWEKERDNYTKTLVSNGGQRFFETWISSLRKDAQVKAFIE